MCNNNNRYTGRPTTILQVRARKHAVRERACGRAFALVREGDSDRGEQALHRGGARIAGQARYCRATSIIILGAAYTVTCPDPGRTPKLRVVMDPLTLP